MTTKKLKTIVIYNVDSMKFFRNVAVVFLQFTMPSISFDNKRFQFRNDAGLLLGKLMYLFLAGRQTVELTWSAMTLHSKTPLK